MRLANKVVAGLALLGWGALADGDPATAAHQVLDARLGELEGCFRGNVAAAMGFNGVLTVRLSVRRDGVVSRSVLLRGTGLPHYRDQCVVDRLKQMKLPAGTPATLSHRFEWRHPMPGAEMFDAVVDGGT